MKLPPSPRIIFESDPTAAMPFVGIAKKWARQTYQSGVRARTYLLGDARIRVENYPESYLSKVFIKSGKMLYDFDLQFMENFTQDGEVISEFQGDRIRFNTRNIKWSIKNPYYSGDNFWIDDRVQGKEKCITWRLFGGTVDSSIEGQYRYKRRESEIFLNGKILYTFYHFMDNPPFTEYEFVVCAGMKDNKVQALLSSGRLILSVADFFSEDEEVQEESYIQIDLPISSDDYLFFDKQELYDIGLSWTDATYFSFSQSGEKIIAYKTTYYHNINLRNQEVPFYLFEASLVHDDDSVLYEWQFERGTWEQVWATNNTHEYNETITSLDQTVNSPYPAVTDITSPVTNTPFPASSGFPTSIKSHEGTEVTRTYNSDADILVCAGYINDEIKILVANIKSSGTHYRKFLLERKDITWAIPIGGIAGLPSSLIATMTFWPPDWGNPDDPNWRTVQVRSAYPFVKEQGITEDRFNSDESMFVSFRFLGESPFFSKQILDLEDYRETTYSSLGKPQGDWVIGERPYPTTSWHRGVIEEYDGSTWSFVRYVDKSEYLDRSYLPIPDGQRFTFSSSIEEGVVTGEGVWTISAGEHYEIALGGVYSDYWAYPGRWGATLAWPQLEGGSLPVHPVYLNIDTYSMPQIEYKTPVAAGTSSISENRTGYFEDYRVIPFLYQPAYIYLGKTTMRKWNYTFNGNPFFSYLGKPDTSVQQIFLNGQVLFDGEYRWEISPIFLDYGRETTGLIYYNEDGEPIDAEGNLLTTERDGSNVNGVPIIYRGTPFTNASWGLTPSNFTWGFLADFEGPIARAFYLTNFAIRCSKFGSILATVYDSDDIHWDQGEFIEALDAYLLAKGIVQPSKQLKNIRVV